MAREVCFRPQSQNLSKRIIDGIAIGSPDPDRDGRRQRAEKWGGGLGSQVDRPWGLCWVLLSAEPQPTD